MRGYSDFKRMKLSPKILEILRYIEDHGFRSCKEMRETLLKPYERSWSWRIMQKLVTENLVRRVTDSEGKLIGWSPLRKSAEAVSDTGEVLRIERGKIPKFSSSFHHDYEVRQLLDQVTKLPNTKLVWTESKLKEALFSNIRGASKREVNRLLSLLPDGRFTIQSGNHDYEMALELELTQKTHARTQVKLEHYVSKTNYDLVIYACGDERILSAVQRNHEAVLRNSPAAKFASKKVPIYFSLHSDLKSDFLNAKIKSRDDEFTFGGMGA